MAKKKHKSPEENQRLALEAKELLRSKQVKTIGAAIKRVGINYSAFRKYSKGKRGAKPIPDKIEFQDMGAVFRPGKTVIIVTQDKEAAAVIVASILGG
jgi:ACT domain-containing protein